MAYSRRRQARQNSASRSRRKDSGTEAEPSRRVTMQDIIEARKSIDRAWATYFGTTLHAAFWPELYGKPPRDRVLPAIRCPELFGQARSDSATSRHLTSSESRPRGALPHQETPRSRSRALPRARRAAIELRTRQTNERRRRGKGSS
jgi:hypothetical protein